MSFIILFIFTFLFSTKTFAQTATPTLNPKAEEVKKMAEKKVQDILNAGTTEIDIAVAKALTGTITKIENNQITITSKNESKIINTTADTIFIDAKKNKIKSTALKSGQIILVMGYYDKSENFEAKRIIITSAEAITNKNEIIYGKIADISKTSNVLVLIPFKNKNTQYQIKIDSNTVIVDKNGTSLPLSKLKSGQKVIVIIQPDAKIANTFDVSKIITVTENP